MVTYFRYEAAIWVMMTCFGCTLDGCTMHLITWYCVNTRNGNSRSGNRQVSEVRPIFLNSDNMLFIFPNLRYSVQLQTMFEILKCTQVTLNQLEKCEE